MMQLFEHFGVSLDNQIIYEIPILQSILNGFVAPFTPTLQTQLQPLIINQDVIVGQYPQSDTPHPKTKKIIKKKKTIDNDTSEESSEFVFIKYKPYARRKRTKPQGYPTKNFLQNFKAPHLNFLQKFLKSDFVNGFQKFKKIKDKNGINMKDYQTLYKIPEFELAFVHFFAQKILYRELLKSRSIQGVKKIHHKKLHVFEQAFVRRRFSNIN